MEKSFVDRSKFISWLWQSCKHRIGVFPGLWLLCALGVVLNATRKQNKSSLFLTHDEDYVWHSAWRMVLSSTLPVIVGALFLTRFARLAQKRKSQRTERTPSAMLELEPNPLPGLLCTPRINCGQTTEVVEIENMDETVTDEGEAEAETVTIGVMTTISQLESMSPLSSRGCNKAINTSHRPHSIARPTGTPTNNASKKKIRKAQKTMEDVQAVIKAERREKMKEWRSSLTKYRNKLLQLIRKTEDRSKLVGYVFSSRMASQKDVENTAVYVRSLKEELNHQCQQNEKMRNNIMRSRPRHLY